VILRNGRHANIHAPIKKVLKIRHDPELGNGLRSVDHWQTTPVVALWPIYNWVVPLDGSTWYLALTESGSYYAALRTAK
jgi:hypothetical protein